MEQQQRIQQLTEEVLSIIPQYEAEVGSKRKAWPSSIRKRVLKLCQLGVKPKKVEDLTGIPYMTLLKWRKEAGLPIRQTRRGKKDKFHSMSLVPTTVVDKPETTTVVDVKESAKEVITITTPEGIKVEFSDHKMALKILKNLRGS